MCSSDLMQLIFTHVNFVYSRDIWPVFFSELMVMSAVMLSMVVRNDSVVLSFCSLGVLVMILTMLYAFLQCASNFQHNSEQFLRQKQRQASRSPYLRRVHRSCKKCTSFRVRVGPFFYVKKVTMTTVASIVFENACVILILGMN